MLSGVPQGSILGPLLFLIYIDKAANCVSSSSIAMYADDIALYRSISSQSDYSKLQDDVNSLCYWISHNHLKLNVQKCCYMTFSRKHSPTLPNSTLTIDDNFSLSRVDVFKYLGVNFSSDFSWTKHITSTCNKSRKLIGMLHRSFYKYSKPDSTSKLYKSLIRPHLEYASAVWSPHLAKDIKLLEDTQKFALKVCTKKWDENYETLLTMCNIKTLAMRRSIVRLCLLFKIISGEIPYPNLPFTIRAQPYQLRHLNTKQLSGHGRYISCIL